MHVWRIVVVLGLIGCAATHGEDEDAGPPGEESDAGRCTPVAASWTETIPIEPAAGSTDAYRHELLAHPNGGMQVLWAEVDESGGRIMGRRVDAAGELVGEPVLLVRTGSFEVQLFAAGRFGDDFVTFFVEDRTLRTGRLGPGDVVEPVEDILGPVPFWNAGELIPRANGGAELRLPDNNAIYDGITTLVPLDREGRPSGARYWHPGAAVRLYPHIVDWQGRAVMTWSSREPTADDFVRWATTEWGSSAEYGFENRVVQPEAEAGPAMALFGGLYVEVINDRGSVLHRLDERGATIPLAEGPSLGSMIVTIPDGTFAVTLHVDGFGPSTRQPQEIALRELTPSGPVGPATTLAGADCFIRGNFMTRSLVRVAAGDDGSLGVLWRECGEPANAFLRIRRPSRCE